jgi:tetratricopeptide (TPR) repeat protein
MSELVILSLGPGNFSDGFPAVTARLGKPGNLWMQFTGSLPPAPEIPQLYKNWRLLYEALYSYRRRSIEIAPVGITNISESAMSDICQHLENSINTWLSADGFHNIESQLRTQLNPSEPVRVIIESDNDDVWRLPWHLWSFVKDAYRQSEIALSTPEYPPPVLPRPKTTQTKIKILAILGNSAGINLKRDRDLLKQLPGVELKLLVEPQRQELNDQLWDQGWDILFFAGHSSSQTDATAGRLYINQNPQNNSLTIEELREALNRAIYRGLQLVIFNSCDGLGLPRDLAAAKIPLPPTIAMREPVADPVAQAFLKYFLKNFAYGEPFHLAVRQAREQLKGLEEQFPSASWLPVICQHPAVVPPTWPELSGMSDAREGTTLWGTRPEEAPARRVDRISGLKSTGNGFAPFFNAVSRFSAMLVVGCLASYLLASPKIAIVLNELGLHNQRHGQLFMAQVYYRMATVLDPKFAQPHYNLAWLCDESLGDTKCARQGYQRAAMRGLSEAYAELARLQILENNDREALKAIWQGLELTQYDAVKASLLKDRGWIRWKQKRLDEAEADLQSAIALVQDSPHSHCLLAQVLEAKGRQQEALVAWKHTKQYSEYNVPEQDECIDWANQRLQGQEEER